MGNSNASQKNERKPFTIELDEHLPFNGTSSVMLMSSNELGKAVSDLFHSVFADFEGCMFETSANNQHPPFFSLFFNHGEYDENDTVACERANGGKSGQDGTVLQRIRYRDACLTNGDQFILNEDGKDAIKPLLLPRYFNNGKPLWKQIANEFTEGQQGLYGYRGMQYTKVSFIDLNRLCALLFGEKEDDCFYDYSANIFAPMNNNAFSNQMVSNYMLSITRISEKEIKFAYEKLGLAYVSRIIR